MNNNINGLTYKQRYYLEHRDIILKRQREARILKNIINPCNRYIARCFLLENKDLIISLYNDGMSVKAIRNKILKDNKVKISPPTIRDFLKRNGISIRTSISYLPKYKCNDYFFDKIDTPIKAYICGWVWTDGCNYNKRNALIIELHEKDKQILEFINNQLENTRPIIFKKTNDYPQYRLYCYSKRISEQLTKLGCPPRKSLILQFPTFLTASLLPFFILGVLEGDGCVAVYPKHSCYRIDFTGTKEFLYGIGEAIKTNLDIKYSLTKEKRTKNNTYYLRFFGIDACKKIKTFLYKNVNFPILSRKYERFSLIP